MCLSMYIKALIMKTEKARNKGSNVWRAMKCTVSCTFSSAVFLPLETALWFKTAFFLFKRRFQLIFKIQSSTAVGCQGFSIHLDLTASSSELFMQQFYCDENQLILRKGGRERNTILFHQHKQKMQINNKYNFPGLWDFPAQRRCLLFTLCIYWGEQQGEHSTYYLWVYLSQGKLW